MTEQQTRRVFLLGSAGLALAGCSLPNLEEIVGPPDAPQLYVLRPALPQAGGAQVAWQLVIALPDAPASLDTPRIALNPTPTTLDYYANAAWQDRVPILLQTLLVQAFENTRRIPVTRDTAGVAANYILMTDIRDFQARYEGGAAPPPANAEGSTLVTPIPGTTPRVMVQLEAKLVAMPGRRIVANLNSSADAPAQANSVEAVVLAFNDAVGRAIGQIVTWTLQAPPPPA
jgi:cholesterol transport system auxiliary component